MKLVLFDFNRTLYDPDTKCLVSGALELLTALRDQSVPLVLVSRLEADRADALQRLGIAEFFVEAIFTPQKSATLFREIIARNGSVPEATYVIGDHLHSEIREGNTVGARTIHIQQGAFAHLQPEVPEDVPWRSVSRLSECLPFIV